MLISFILKELNGFGVHIRNALILVKKMQNAECSEYLKMLVS